MPGSTLRYKLPYPVAGDPINQGAVAIQNLANRIEAVLANANVPVPFSAAPPEPLRGIMDDDPNADDAGA